MLNSRLCNYSDTCILFRGTLTLVGQGANAAARQTDRNNKQVIYLKILHHLLTV